MNNILVGLLLPFIGTSIGAACVFILKEDLNITLQKAYQALLLELW